MKKTKKEYAAWTRKAGSNDQFITQFIDAYSKKEAKRLIEEGGREIQKDSQGVYLRK